MDLDFTQEQGMIRDSAAQFVAKECPFDLVRELEESQEGYSPDMWKKMCELGWFEMLIPEAYGGFGGSFLELILIQEELGKRLVPSPFFSTIVQCGLAILEGGTEDQKQAMLPRIADGSLILALAQYEADGSYLPSAIRMTAEGTDGGYRLSGTKLFVMDANIADKLIVLAHAGGGGLTLFIVDTEDPGVKVEKLPAIGKDNTCAVEFADVQIESDAVLGDVGSGWETLEKVFPKATIAKAAEMIGGCKACIDMTSGYAKERIQYEAPIGGYQAIQHYMANMLLAYDTIHEYLYRVACMVDEGRDCALEASILKSSANENYKFISERSVQIHGGIGTTREYDIGLFYRKAKSCEFMCGDTDFHHERIMDRCVTELPAY